MSDHAALHRHSLHSLLGAASPTAPPIGSQLRMPPPPGFCEKLVTFSNHGVLGLELSQRAPGTPGGTVVVARLVPGGAAERCKRIKIGDAVRSINGLEVEDVPLEKMGPVLRQQAIAICLWRPLQGSPLGAAAAAAAVTAAAAGGGVGDGGDAAAAGGVRPKSGALVSPEDPWRHLAEAGVGPARAADSGGDMPASAGGGAGRRGTWGVQKKSSASGAPGAGGGEGGGAAAAAAAASRGGYSVVSAAQVDASAARMHDMAMGARGGGGGRGGQQQSPERSRKSTAFAKRAASNQSTRQLIGGLQSRSLSVLVGSWNVGNRQPPKLLGSWVEPGGGEHDVIAVGMQECAYSTKDAQAVGAPCPGRSLTEALAEAELLAQERTAADEALAEHPFIRQLQLHLGRDFVTAALTQLNEMRLVVFVRQKYYARDAVGGLEVTDTATGIAGVYGNKGGLVAKLSIYGTTLCFVSCHLAAHEGAGFLARRHKDIRDIMSDSRTGERDLDLASQYAHVWFFGDMNYRVDMALNMSMGEQRLRFTSGTKIPKGGQHAAVLEAVAKGALDPAGLPWLLGRDELRWEHKQKKVLVGWHDCLNELLRLADRSCRDASGATFDTESGSRARIAKSAADQELAMMRQTEALFVDEADDRHVLFPPTFKLVPNTDGEKYSPKRLPSWTDRVFWRSMPGLRDTLKLKHFRSHPELASSDHAPVSAAFMVGCPPVSPTAFDPSKSPEIWITNMRAERLVAMDFNGKSDPYVRFYSYPRGLLRVRSKHGNIKNGHKGQKFPQTARKDMTLTPMWEDREVPNLLLAQTSKEHVLHQSLVLALYDWDRMSQDDLMGQVCIPMADFATAREPVHVVGDLTLHGECAGTVEFDVEVRGELPARLPARCRFERPATNHFPLFYPTPILALLRIDGVALCRWPTDHPNTPGVRWAA